METTKKTQDPEYFKKYYLANPDKYKHKSKKLYEYFIELNGVKHSFKTKGEIYKLIQRELINQ